MGVFDSLLKQLQALGGVPGEVSKGIMTPYNWLINQGFGGSSGQSPSVGGTLNAPPQPGQPGSPLNPGSPFQLPLIKPVDPMESYLEQLLRGLNAGKPSMLSLQEMRERAAKQAGAEFDPQISALYGEMSRTKTRAGKNKKELGSLYGNLADSYLGEVQGSKQNTKAAKQAEAQAYKQLQKQVSSDYGNQFKEQSAELKALGIEAALGESTKGQKEDLQFLNAINATESGAQQKALDLTGLADANYYQQGRGLAQQRGAEDISDLMARLNDYLSEAGTQVAGLKGQKSSAIEQLVQQMQSGQTDNQQQFENQRWNRLLQLAQFQNQLASQAAKAGAPSEVPSKGLEGAYGVLGGAPGTNSQKTISALMNLLQTQPFREGRFEAGNKQIVDMTPENAAYQARAYASQNGLSAAEADALVKAVYAYYGKLR
jgi:hypothetical protein